MSGTTPPAALAPAVDSSDKWRAIISLFILTMFAGLGAAFIFRTITDSPSLQNMTGSLISMVSGVVGYWVGSSAGSTKKSATLAAVIGASNQP